MKIEYVDAEPKKPKVPFVRGGVYWCNRTEETYILSACRCGGYQLSGAVNGYVFTAGEFDTIESATRTLNSGPWEYIHDAKLVISKEVAK